MSYPAIADYLALFASQHQAKPKLAAITALIAQPLIDNANLCLSFDTLFDVGQAVGDQQDKVGQLIGVNRYVTLPSSAGYFAWDTPGQGWDQGSWLGPYQSATINMPLTDAQYRLLQFARIMNNNWDGSIPGAYAIWNAIVPNNMPFQFFLQDNGNRSMIVGIASPTVPLDSVTLALLTSGKLDIKPVGVSITYAFLPSVAAPIFAFDLDTPSFQGFDSGQWATLESA